MRLVSCMMPTRGRAQLAQLAVESFLAQDYEPKELVVLDDEDQPSFPDGIDHGLVRYYRERRLYVGAKRNKCAELAAGEILCHFDSDDYSTPDRISHQVQLLAESGKQLCAYHSILFYGPEPGRVTCYGGNAETNLGTSYMYFKSWWRRHRFPDTAQHRAEDGVFLHMALDQNAVISVDGTRRLVARIHPDNTTAKTNGNYRPVSIADLPKFALDLIGVPKIG